MNTKRLLVSLCTFAIALFLVATVSATCSDCGCSVAPISPTSADALASCATIEVEGIDILSNPSVIAGETVAVKVTFVSNVTESDVRVKVELEGDKANVYAVSTPFDVETNRTYTKTLTLKVPFELKDDVSDVLDLNVKIWNGDAESEYENLPLSVQRPSYNPVVKSISVSQTVEAGETLPVDFVLKNMGYNDMEDVYVTVSVPELGVEKTAYFGDLVTFETCDDDDDCDEDDTVSGRLYVEVPYSAKAGTYDLEVEVSNDDVTSTFAKQIVVENDFSNNVIVSTTSKTVAVGQEAEYSLLLVNPTNSLKLYRVVTGSSSEVTSSTNDAVVAVPAGSSKTVTVTAKAASEGEYKFDVNVFTGEKLTDTVTLTLNAKGNKNAVSNPIVVLTIVLAIIFLVLLIVLIVLLGKKPRKQEEFGESYY